jgi:Sigma-70 region 2
VFSTVLNRETTDLLTPTEADFDGALFGAGEPETPSSERFFDDRQRRRFECLTLQHLDAAYNLARWLVHNEDDANDIVQDAFLRAMRSFDGFKGDNARPWLLAIVRNTRRLPG